MDDLESLWDGLLSRHDESIRAAWAVLSRREQRAVHAHLVRMATEKGRATRPDIKLGICGEHGGDPASIHFCESVGLDYVSCSPFRVPIARLAAAGVSEVVVKDGARPVVMFSGEEICTVPTPEVRGIRDTTGAGDSFNAGYLSARLIGRSAEIAVTGGQRFSGEVIQHFGARLPKSCVPILSESP